MIIEGAEFDLIEVQELNHKMPMVKKKNFVFNLIENFIDTLVFDHATLKICIRMVGDLLS